MRRIDVLTNNDQSRQRVAHDLLPWPVPLPWQRSQLGSATVSLHISDAVQWSKQVKTTTFCWNAAKSAIKRALKMIKNK